LSLPPLTSNLVLQGGHLFVFFRGVEQIGIGDLPFLEFAIAAGSGMHGPGHIVCAATSTQKQAVFTASLHPIHFEN
jgi:hypothetical protein